jgi:hypothetical protein
MLAFESFLVSKILSGAKTFPFLVKMHVFSLHRSPKTGITLLSIIEGVHSFGTARRHLHCCRCRHRHETTASEATSLLSRIISAEDGPGGELTRRSALPLPLPPLTGQSSHFILL